MKDIYGYTVVRKTDNHIMDDGIDSKDGSMLFVYPVFKKLADCKKYVRDTYNHNGVMKLRWYQGLQIKKVKLIIE